MSWMDVLIIVIFSINLIKGWRNGLILSVFYMGSYVVSGIAAKMYSPVVSKYIMENPTLFLKIQKLIVGRVRTAANEQPVTGGILAERNLFQVLNFPKGLENLFMKSETVKDVSAGAMNSMHSYIADFLTRMFIDFISILIVFLAVKVILFMIGYFLSGISKLPVLSQFNHFGGAALGCLKGLLIVFIFLAVITPFTTMTNSGVFMEGLESSIIAKALYDHNPIIGFIEGILEG